MILLPQNMSMESPTLLAFPFLTFLLPSGHFIYICPAAETTALQQITPGSFPPRLLRGGGGEGRNPLTAKENHP